MSSIGVGDILVGLSVIAGYWYSHDPFVTYSAGLLMLCAISWVQYHRQAILRLFTRIRR